MRIKDICSGVTDGSHNPPQGLENSDYLMLSSKNVFDDKITFDSPRYLSQIDFEQESKRTRIKSGDVLLTIVGTVGRAAVVGENMPQFTLQRSVAVLHPNVEICDSRYLMYALQANRNHIESRAKGVAQKGIYLKEVADIELQIPLLSEQTHRVKVLDKIAFVIKFHQKQLQKLDELIKARFVELFGDPISNPNGWKTEKAEMYIDLCSGFPFDSSQYTESGVNICGGLIIMPQRIEWNDCKHWCSTEGYEEYTLKKNDIVIALDRPWISEGFKIAMVDTEHLPALLIQRTARIRAIDINQFYLMYCFLLGGFDNHCNVTGSLVPHISAKDIRSFPIMLPPMGLQEQFAAFVEQVNKSKLLQFFCFPI